MKLKVDKLAQHKNGSLSVNQIWAEVHHIPEGDDEDDGKVVVTMDKTTVTNRVKTVWKEQFSEDKLDQIEIEWGGSSRTAFLRQHRSFPDVVGKLKENALQRVMMFSTPPLMNLLMVIAVSNGCIFLFQCLSFDVLYLLQLLFTAPNVYCCYFRLCPPFIQTNACCDGVQCSI